MKNTVKLGAAVLALALATGSASAAVYEFTFSTTAGDSAQGWLTTDVSDVVTSIKGGFDNLSITGLSNYAGADQQLVPAVAPYVDFSGISFKAANGVSYNWTVLPFPTGGIGNSTSDPIGYGGLNVAFTSVTITSVPEVSTWAMMLAGFAAIGFVGYRRNKAAALAA
jgi:hypothetical protein